MLVTGKLWSYLAEIEVAAEERFECIENQLMQSDQLKESLKNENPLEWIQKRQQIRICAEELVLEEFIYR